MKKFEIVRWMTMAFLLMQKLDEQKMQIGEQINSKENLQKCGWVIFFLFKAHQSAQCHLQHPQAGQHDGGAPQRDRGGVHCLSHNKGEFENFCKEENENWQYEALLFYFFYHVANFSLITD